MRPHSLLPQAPHHLLGHLPRSPRPARVHVHRLRVRARLLVRGSHPRGQQLLVRLRHRFLVVCVRDGLDEHTAADPPGRGRHHASRSRVRSFVSFACVRVHRRRGPRRAATSPLGADTTLGATRDGGSPIGARRSREVVRLRVSALVATPAASPVSLIGGRLLVTLVASAHQAPLLRLVAIVSLEQGAVRGDVLVHGVELVALIAEPALRSLGLLFELHVQRGAVGGARAGANLVHGLTNRVATRHAALR